MYDLTKEVRLTDFTRDTAWACFAPWRNVFFRSTSHAPRLDVFRTHTKTAQTVIA